MITPMFGRPGIGPTRTAQRKFVSRDGVLMFFAGGKIIDGTKSRDSSNTDDTKHLQPGLLLGKVSASGKYAPSIMGVLDEAYASGTTLVMTVAGATELARRVGSTGTFKLTGPPVASGTVRTQTVTFSAVDTATGDVTITALPVAAVWTLTPISGTDGGTFKLKVTLPDGTSATTAAITFSATGATFQASIDAAIEALSNLPDNAATVASTDTTGVSVMTFIASLGAVQVEVVEDRLTDGSVFLGEAQLVNTTAGVDGRFVAGSFVGPTDGSETPLTFIGDGYGLVIPEVAADIEFPMVPIGGVIDVDQLINWPSDSSLKTWVRDSLSTLPGGKWTFSDKF